MLVLSRKQGEKVIIGNGIAVTVLEVQGNRVRLGIEAPDDVRILREELSFFQGEPVVNNQPRRQTAPARKSHTAEPCIVRG